MKVVFVNRYFSPDHSATSQLLTDQAFHLAKSGLSIHVVTSRQIYDSPDAVLSVSESIQGVRVTRVKTTRFGRSNLLGRTVDYMTFYVSAAWSLFVVLRPGDIVVAKTDPPLISVIAAVIGRIRRVRIINWLQDLFPEVAEALEVCGVKRFGRIIRTARNWSLKVACMNIAIGDRMAIKMKEEGIAQDRITVIHNWADGSTIQSIDRENNELRTEWSLQGKFVVGYSGNLGRAHEFDTILGAAGLLKSNKEICFLFIGGGAQRNWLEDEIAKKGLSNVLFKPYQPRERLRLSLNVPDVHLISLRPELEGLIVPSKFYGIAAAGRPTLFVGDSDGEIPKILLENSCGNTVPIGDYQALSGHIIRMKSGAMAMEMGARARRAFEKYYDRKHAFAAWEHLLRQVSMTQ